MSFESSKRKTRVKGYTQGAYDTKGYSVKSHTRGKPHRRKR